MSLKVSGGGSPQPASRAPESGCLPLHAFVPGSGRLGWLGVGATRSFFPLFCVFFPGVGRVQACDAHVFVHFPSLGRQSRPWRVVGWGLAGICSGPESPVPALYPSQVPQAEGQGLGSAYRG